MRQMKFNQINLLALILMTCSVTFFGCDKLEDDPDDAGSSSSLSLSCGSTLPANFQCIKGPTGLSTTTTYKIPEVWGAWNSNSYDFCVTYSSNGTGIIRYKPSGLSSGSTQNIKWGAMVNSKGELLVSSAGSIMIVHQSTSSTPVDPQIASLTFFRSSATWYGFDLKKVSSCN